MKIAKGQTVLLTGASGGLGVHIAREFARFGVNQALVAWPGAALPPLEKEIKAAGVDAFFLAADLRQPEEQQRVIDAVREKFGNLDILINNAGVEFTRDYHQLEEEEILSVLRVNLEAPLMLARKALPRMLERGTGHIVNMSSLAGKSGPACQEPYAATKAGLVAFTESLRATYHGTGVSASLICPGFVEAGIYTRLKERTGISAPLVLGTVPPERIPRAIVRAIQKDLPDVIVNQWPIRPLFAFTALFPRLGERVVRMTGAHRFFKRVAEAELRLKNGGPTKS